MANVIEYRGIRSLKGAIITDGADGETYGTPFDISGVASISRSTQSSSATHYYDNAPAIVIDSVGADEVTIEASALPLDIVAKLTGQVYNETKGMLVEGNPNPPYVAIGYVTSKSDGSDVFVWRLRGKFSVPDVQHNTKDDGTDANGQTLVYTGINTIKKFTNAGGKSAKAVNVDTSVNKTITETAFFTSVQTPDSLVSGS